MRRRWCLRVVLLILATTPARPSSAEESLILGLSLKECSKCGMVHVTQVYAGFPATRLIRVSDGQQFTLEAGYDSITHINGTSVRTLNEFFRELGKANGSTTLRVYDKARQTTADYRVSLGFRPMPPLPVPAQRNEPRRDIDPPVPTTPATDSGPKAPQIAPLPKPLPKLKSLTLDLN